MHDPADPIEEAMWQANYECDWVADRSTLELCAGVARDLVAAETEKAEEEALDYVLEVLDEAKDYSGGVEWAMRVIRQDIEVDKGRRARAAAALEADHA